MADAPRWQWAFLHPKYWGIWLFVLLLLPMTLLPFWAQFGLGRILGCAFFYLGHRRRQDTLTNLRLCFPHLDETKRCQMAKEVFINQGIGIFETLTAWIYPNRFWGKGRFINLEALPKDRPVLLLGAHYTLLDVMSCLCYPIGRSACVYRPQNSPLLNWLICWMRAPFFCKQIRARDVKSIARHLRDGGILWYAPDQDFGLAHGVMARFFGVPAATITAPRRLIELARVDVCVVMMHAQRAQDNTYIVRFERIAPFPRIDALADAQCINDHLERLIMHAPTQYMWFHRRFKTQVQGKNPYDKAR